MNTRRGSRTTRLTRAILTSALGAALTSPALAGQSLDSSRPPTAAEAAARLAPGSEVRVRLLSGSVVEGRLLEPAASARDTVGILSRGVVPGSRAELRLRRVPLDSVAEAWQPASNVGRYASGMATVGAILGALSFGSLGYGLCDAAICDGAFAEAATLGAPMGAAAGALIGGLVGGLSRHWTLLGGAQRPGPGLRWSASMGRPWGATGGLEPVSSLRASLGWDVASSWEAYAEVVRLGLGDTEGRFASTRLSRPSAEEDGRVLSWLAGLGHRFSDTSHARLRTGVGIANTTVHPDLMGSAGERLPDASDPGPALHVSGALELGWHPWSLEGWGFGLRCGVDWLSSTPWGSLTTLTLALSTWH